MESEKALGDSPTDDAADTIEVHIVGMAPDEMTQRDLDFIVAVVALLKRQGRGERDPNCNCEGCQRYRERMKQQAH